MTDLKIELANGKYTYVLHEDGRQHALRHGEIWRDLVGDKFVYWLAQHAEALRVLNEQLTQKLAAQAEEGKRLLREEMDRGNRGTEAALEVRELKEKLVALIKSAQDILAKHLPPDGTDEKNTIVELLDLLDGPQSREVLTAAGAA